MRSAAAWALAAVLAIQGYAYADELTPQKRADIRELIGASGTMQVSGQLSEITSRSVATTLRRTRPDIPERVLSAINQAVGTLFEERLEAPGGLVDRMILVYHNHFTHPEIRELLAFNQTPIGRKTLQVMPTLMNDSVAAGQAWGQSLAPEVRQRIETVLKREGYTPPARAQ